MFYTGTIFGTVVNNFVPMGEELIKKGSKVLGLNYSESPKPTKHELKNKATVAKCMQRAIKDGKLSPSYTKAVNAMHVKAKIELAEQNYQDKQHWLDEVYKAATLLDFAISPVLPAVRLVPRTNRPYYLPGCPLER